MQRNREREEIDKIPSLRRQQCCVVVETKEREKENLVAIRVGAERVFRGQHSRRNEDTGKDNVPEVVVVAEPVAEHAEP